jgi:hypothetical protein
LRSSAPTRRERAAQRILMIVSKRVAQRSLSTELAQERDLTHAIMGIEGD